MLQDLSEVRRQGHERLQKLLQQLLHHDTFVDFYFADILKFRPETVEPCTEALSPLRQLVVSTLGWVQR